MFLTLAISGLVVYFAFYAVTTVFLDSDVMLAFYEKFGKSPRRLKGKVAFITGASSGIGEHIAYEFAKNGVKLVIAARRNEELQRVKRRCIELSQDQLQDKDILVIPMDVTDILSHKMHFQHALRHFGTVDILVNNAGRSQRAMWDTTEIGVDKQMFELNVFAVVNLTRVALEHFNKTGCGNIAVVTSLAGVIGVPFSGTYTGTKHAIHGYFNALRTEKAQSNIHVSLLCPGPTFTNFLAESFTEKEGKKYNMSVQPTDKRMTAERCGYLSVVAIANNIGEAWISVPPILSLVYIAVYWPILYKIGVKILGPEILFKLRDSKKLEEMGKTA